MYLLHGLTEYLRDPWIQSGQEVNRSGGRRIAENDSYSFRYISSEMPAVQRMAATDCDGLNKTESFGARNGYFLLMNI